MVMTESPIPREQRPAIASYLSQRLAGPVGIDVWTQQASQLIRTDRDPCTFCDQVASAAKQLASLHPLISLTLYDLDRHADRAREAGIERPPVTVVRGANGREFRLVGMWSGLLFPAFVDGVVFAGAGEAPIQEQTRAALQALDDERTESLPIELLIAPTTRTRRTRSASPRPSPSSRGASASRRSRSRSSRGWPRRGWCATCRCSASTAAASPARGRSRS